MESRLEDHHTEAGENAIKRIDGHQVREAAYGNMLAGVAGHGYGCNDIFQFYDPCSHRPSYTKEYSYPFRAWSGTTSWRKAMDFEGPNDMGLMRKLYELRPWY